MNGMTDRIETTIARRTGGFLAGLVLLSCPCILGEPPPLPAGDAGFNLRGWGKVGMELKSGSGFREFTLYERDGRGKLVSTKLILQVPEDAPLLADRRVRIGDLKEGESIAVLGRPKEYEVRGRRGGAGGGAGRSGRDYQIQNCQAVFVGKDVAVKTGYKDRTDPATAWCQGTVARDGSKGLWMQYNGQEHRVAMGPRTPLVKRIEAPRKLLKTGVYLFVEAGECDEDPPARKKSDADKKCYRAKRLVLLDPRLLKTVYPAMF